MTHSFFTEHQARIGLPQIDRLTFFKTEGFEGVELELTRIMMRGLLPVLGAPDIAHAPVNLTETIFLPQAERQFYVHYQLLTASLSTNVIAYSKASGSAFRASAYSHYGWGVSHDGCPPRKVMMLFRGNTPHRCVICCYHLVQSMQTACRHS